MAPAADAALSTPELLEAVLVHVDMRTLLVSVPRVCRNWHALHAASLPIKRALFLHPDRDAALPEDDDDDDYDDDDDEHTRRRVQNPLPVELFPAWFENTGPWELLTYGSYMYAHPWETIASRGFERFEELPLYEASRAIGVDNNPFLRRDASWRKMLVAQPPCRTVIVNVSGTPDMEFHKFLGKPRVYRYDNGLHMGELYDMTLGHCSGNPTSGFTVAWLRSGYRGSLELLQALWYLVVSLPDIFDLDCDRVGGVQPDLVVQMQRARRGTIPRLTELWEGCGSNVFDFIQNRRRISRSAKPGISTAIKQYEMILKSLGG